MDDSKPAFLKSREGVILLESNRATSFGREFCDINIKTSSVDIRHATIEYSQSRDGYVLRDLNSSYGCYVNDTLVQGTCSRLNNGDYIRMGIGEKAATFRIFTDRPPRKDESDLSLSEGKKYYCSDSRPSSRPAARTVSLPYTVTQPVKQDVGKSASAPIPAKGREGKRVRTTDEPSPPTVSVRSERPTILRKSSQRTSEQSKENNSNSHKKSDKGRNISNSHAKSDKERNISNSHSTSAGSDSPVDSLVDSRAADSSIPLTDKRSDRSRTDRQSVKIVVNGDSQSSLEIPEKAESIKSKESSRKSMSTAALNRRMSRRQSRKTITQADSEYTASPSGSENTEDERRRRKKKKNTPSLTSISTQTDPEDEMSQSKTTGNSRMSWDTENNESVDVKPQKNKSKGEKQTKAKKSEKIKNTDPKLEQELNELKNRVCCLQNQLDATSICYPCGSQSYTKCVTSDAPPINFCTATESFYSPDRLSDCYMSPDCCDDLGWDCSGLEEAGGDAGGCTDSPMLMSCRQLENELRLAGVNIDSFLDNDWYSQLLQLKSLTDQISRLYDDNDHLNKQLVQFKRNSAMKEKELTEYIADKDRKLVTFDSCKDRNEELIQEVERLQKQVDDMTSTLAAAMSGNYLEGGGFSAMAHRASGMTMESQFEEEAMKRKEESMTLVAEINALKVEIEDMKYVNEQLEKDMADKRDEMLHLEEKYDEVRSSERSNLTAMKCMLEELESAKKELEHEKDLVHKLSLSLDRLAATSSTELAVKGKIEEDLEEEGSRFATSLMGVLGNDGLKSNGVRSVILHVMEKFLPAYATRAVHEPMRLALVSFCEQLLDSIDRKGDPNSINYVRKPDLGANCGADGEEDGGCLAPEEAIGYVNPSSHGEQAEGKAKKRSSAGHGALEYPEETCDFLAVIGADHVNVPPECRVLVVELEEACKKYKEMSMAKAVEIEFLKRQRQELLCEVTQYRTLETHLRQEILEMGYSKAEVRLSVEKELRAGHAEEVEQLKERHSLALQQLELQMSQLCVDIRRRKSKAGQVRVCATSAAVDEDKRWKEHMKKICLTHKDEKEKLKQVSLCLAQKLDAKTEETESIIGHLTAQLEQASIVIARLQERVAVLENPAEVGRLCVEGRHVELLKKEEETRKALLESARSANQGVFTQLKRYDELIQTVSRVSREMSFLRQDLSNPACAALSPDDSSSSAAKTRLELERLGCLCLEEKHTEIFLKEQELIDLLMEQTRGARDQISEQMNQYDKFTAEVQEKSKYMSTVRKNAGGESHMKSLCAGLLGSYKECQSKAAAEERARQAAQPPPRTPDDCGPPRTDVPAAETPAGAALGGSPSATDKEAHVGLASADEPDKAAPPSPAGPRAPPSPAGSRRGRSSSKSRTGRSSSRDYQAGKLARKPSDMLSVTGSFSRKGSSVAGSVSNMKGRSSSIDRRSTEIKPERIGPVERRRKKSERQSEYNDELLTRMTVERNAVNQADPSFTNKKRGTCPPPKRCDCKCEKQTTCCHQPIREKNTSKGDEYKPEQTVSQMRAAVNSKICKSEFSPEALACFEKYLVKNPAGGNWPPKGKDKHGGVATEWEESSAGLASISRQGGMNGETATNVWSAPHGPEGGAGMANVDLDKITIQVLQRLQEPWQIQRLSAAGRMSGGHAPYMERNSYPDENRFSQSQNLFTERIPSTPSILDAGPFVTPGLLPSSSFLKSTDRNNNRASSEKNLRESHDRQQMVGPGDGGTERKVVVKQESMKGRGEMDKYDYGNHIQTKVMGNRIGNFSEKPNGSNTGDEMEGKEYRGKKATNERKRDEGAYSGSKQVIKGRNDRDGMNTNAGSFEPGSTGRSSFSDGKIAGILRKPSPPKYLADSSGKLKPSEDPSGNGRESSGSKNSRNGNKDYKSDDKNDRYFGKDERENDRRGNNGDINDKESNSSELSIGSKSEESGSKYYDKARKDFERRCNDDGKNYRNIARVDGNVAKDSRNTDTGRKDVDGDKRSFEKDDRSNRMDDRNNCEVNSKSNSTERKLDGASNGRRPTSKDPRQGGKEDSSRRVERTSKEVRDLGLNSSNRNVGISGSRSSRGADNVNTNINADGAMNGPRLKKPSSFVQNPNDKDDGNDERIIAVVHAPSDEIANKEMRSRCLRYATISPSLASIFQVEEGPGVPLLMVSDDQRQSSVGASYTLDRDLSSTGLRKNGTSDEDISDTERLRKKALKFRMVVTGRSTPLEAHNSYEFDVRSHKMVCFRLDGDDAPELKTTEELGTELAEKMARLTPKCRMSMAVRRDEDNLDEIEESIQGEIDEKAKDDKNKERDEDIFIGDVQAVSLDAFDLMRQIIPDEMARDDCSDVGDVDDDDDDEDSCDYKSSNSTKSDRESGCGECEFTQPCCD